MVKRLNKTSICSIVFLDIVKYTQLSIEDQSTIKKQFELLITESLKNTPQYDRIILDTGDGAAIAFLGAPEDAMFVSLNIRNSIVNNQNDSLLLKIRFGINLGPVRIINDINGHLNILGDGINVAQRIMSFAAPNQILVSKSYFEVTSRLSKEFMEIFSYSGLRKDKHIREHELYEIKDSLQISFHHNYESYSEDTADFQPNKPTKRILIGYAPYMFMLLIVTLLVALASTSNSKIKRGHDFGEEKKRLEYVNQEVFLGDKSITAPSQSNNSSAHIIYSQEPQSNLSKKENPKNNNKMISKQSNKPSAQKKSEDNQQTKNDKVSSSNATTTSVKECTQGEKALFQCR
jgi:Adenylate and Guanylate cyclase catalytic domain